MLMNIAVYFDDPEILDYPLNNSEYFQAYLELNDLIKEEGHNFYVVRSFDTYEGLGKFSKCWIFKKDKLIENGSVEVEVLYDKGDKDTFKAGDLNVINNRSINEVCANKIETYEKFPDISPATYVVNDSSELKEKFKKINTNKLVIKPLKGFAGKGVRIENVKDFDISSVGDFPILLQEYIDTSGGYKDMITGVHDLRVIVMNGEIILCFVRKPPKGSLLANLALGGSLEYIDIGSLPKSVIDMKNKIDEEFSNYKKRLYSIDLAFENDEPVLIELNSRPGLGPKSRGQEAEDFQRKITKLLTEK